MRFLSILTPKDRIACAIALAVMAVALYLLLNPNLLDTSKETGEEVGKISYIKNDSRKKYWESLAWKNSQKNQAVFLGDAVYSGSGSQTQIFLKSKTTLNLGENSLISFTKVPNSMITSFGEGNFLVQLDGNIDIAIKGKIHTLSGQSSEVQIYIEKDKTPIVKSMKGKVKVTNYQQKSIQIDPGKLVVLKESAFDPKPFVVVMPKKEDIESIQEQPPQKREVASFNDLPDVPLNEVPTTTTLPRKPREPKIISLKDVYQVLESEREESITPLDFKATIDDTKTLAEKPILAAPEKVVAENNIAEAVLEIEASPKYEQFVVESSQDKNFPAEKTEALLTDKKEVLVTFKESGEYFHRTRGVDKKSHLSKPSKPQRTVVNLKGLTLRAIDLAPRKPAAVDTQVTTKIPDPPRTPKDILSKPRIELDYGMTEHYSPDEKDIGNSVAKTTLFGLNITHWFKDKHGFFGSFRAKASSQNNEGSKINPKYLEWQYRYRLDRVFLGQARFSFIGGYETYRNSGTGFFLQKYDLLKVGLGLESSLYKNWSLDSRLLYGRSTDQSTQIEALASLNYFFMQNFSFGIGYKFHIFKAGSLESAPIELPYTEAFGETFSTLKWYY